MLYYKVPTLNSEKAVFILDYNKTKTAVDTMDDAVM